MSTTRKRRIVWRLAIIAALLILGTASTAIMREPPEIARSREVKLGMTIDEVTGVMGNPDFFLFRGHDDDVFFGESVRKRQRFWYLIREWPLANAIAPEVEDWPVRVHFDQHQRADQIVRGGVAEKSVDDSITAAQ